MPETSPCPPPPSDRGLTAAIAGRAENTEVVRFSPHISQGAHAVTVHFYDRLFAKLIVGRDHQLRVARLVRKQFPDLDWRCGYDLHLPTLTLYRSPGPAQAGYVPDDDGCFGLTPLRRIGALDGDSRE